MPKVSSIIVSYNGEKYVARAIRSALAQTYPSNEVIVIDDGSTDATPQIIKSFGDKIKSKRIENSGAAVARNTGIAMAKGDYLAFLDDDDVWFENKIQKQVDAARRFPSAGFISCNFAVRYAHLGNRMVEHFSILKKPELMNYDTILRQNPLKVLIQEHFVGTTSAAFIKKEAMDEAGLFDARYRSSQDYEYFLRLAVKTDFVVLSEVLFYKKNHPGNVSQDVLRTRTYHHDALQNILKTERKYIRRHGLEGVCKQALSESYFYLGNLQFEAKKTKEAYMTFFRGFWENPTLINFIHFLWCASKKSVRLATFNKVRRKK